MHEAHAPSLTHDLDRGNAPSFGVAASGGRGSTPMPLVTLVNSVSSSSLMACTFIMVVWGCRRRSRSTLPSVVVRREREGREMAKRETISR